MGNLFKSKWIVVGLVLALVVGLGIYYYSGRPDSPGITQADALREAESYQPPEGQVCIQVLTQARNIETGAEYTFNNGCIPPGWEVIQEKSIKIE